MNHRITIRYNPSEIKVFHLRQIHNHITEGAWGGTYEGEGVPPHAPSVI